MLNVLMLSELIFPHGGGAELATYLYAKLLAEAKFNVVVITNRFRGEQEFSRCENFFVYRLPLFKKGSSIKFSLLTRFDVLLSSFLRKWLQWADIVYVPRYWFSAIPLAKAYGKHVMVHLHDYIPICPFAVLYDANNHKICTGNGDCSRCISAYENGQKGVFKSSTIKESSSKKFASLFLNLTISKYVYTFLKVCDSIICVSQSQKNLITAQLPSLSTKIQVIPNLLPVLPYIPLEGDDFAYFGGGSKIKGFDTLYRASKELIHMKTRIRAAGFSEGNRVIDLSNGIEIAQHGKVHGKELQDIYRTSSVVVVPSVCPEPLPYIVYEALLRGRLVIASNIGGIPEQVTNCQGCFLFSAGDHKELANLMTHVFSLERSEVIELGYKNRSSLLTKNQNEKSLSVFVNKLESLI